LTDWYANIFKKLFPISKHFEKIVTKAVFVLNFANCIDIDRLRVILWRICELGWGRGPNGTKPVWGGGMETRRVDSFEEGVGEGEGTQQQGWSQVPNQFVGGGAMGARRVDPCTWLGCVGMYCGPPSPSHPHFHNCSGCCPTFPLLLFFAARWVW